LLIVALAGCGSKVKINGDTLRLELGQEQTLSVSAPKKAELTFSSMDPNIASVDENGVVKALGDGVTVITAKTDKGYDHIGVVVGTGAARYVDETGSVVSTLTASPADEAMINGESDITALALSLVGGGSEDVSIGTDRTYEIKVTKTPADSVDKITLRISDPTVARVDGKTLVGVSKGKTLLTATAPNGVSTEMIVRVK
ncbi:MAG: Ig-like domain-containing protein, partial [Clostridia bacterium]